MRSAINENRTVQIILLAVLALGGGLLLLKTTKGSGSQTSAPAASTASTDAGGTTAAVDPTAAGATSTASTPSSAPSVPAAQVPGGAAPKSLLRAYQHGNGVAVLVVRDGGIDDSLVRRSAAGMRSIPGLSVYVTRAKGISRYSWLTQGVDVTELPALVILQPRHVTHGAPKASVSYGFRDGASVLQAAKDALYGGPTNLPYHP